MLDTLPYGTKHTTPYPKIRVDFFWYILGYGTANCTMYQQDTYFRTYAHRHMRTNIRKYENTKIRKTKFWYMGPEATVQYHIYRYHIQKKVLILF